MYLPVYTNILLTLLQARSRMEESNRSWQTNNGRFMLVDHTETDRSRDPESSTVVFYSSSKTISTTSPQRETMVIYYQGTLFVPISIFLHICEAGIFLLHSFLFLSAGGGGGGASNEYTPEDACDPIFIENICSFLFRCQHVMKHLLTNTSEKNVTLLPLSYHMRWKFLYASPSVTKTGAH